MESGHHHHHNEAEIKGRPLALAIALNLLISVAQVFGGILSGSLALLGDALHNFSDVLSLLISYVANKLTHQKEDETRTFGYKRAQILAALINAMTLIGVSVYLIFESVQRLFLNETVISSYVIWLALAGIIINGGSAFLLMNLQKGDSNMRSAYLHLLADLATSFAVLAGGLAMYLYQVYWIDSVITIVVSLYLILMAGKLFLHTTSVLMQFVPKHLDVQVVCKRLQQEEFVNGLHHVHLWRLNDESIHFEAHVLLSENMSITQFEAINKKLSKILKEDFEISHCVFQPEFSGCDHQDLVAQE